MLDLGLAVAHHVLVFGLAVMLAMELALLKGPPVVAKRLTSLDAGYGLTAVLVLAVGTARVVWGGKGWIYYADNPWFWAKIATFTVIGLLSVPPTLAFMRWRKAQGSDASFQPEARDLARVRTIVRLEVLLLFPLVAFAATMARWSA